ncbi:MAG: DUF3102 domain-containing protein [Bacteroidaceae bacterium]|nr:DUF3102 domain-containing protein [Bacteroidaceae bacterium]MBQ5655883.1 DUF3102 domain-containing protein [Bacteroidaceae bacterium]
MSNIIETTGRTAATIAAEIRTLDRQAAGICMSYIIEIGRRLVEAKSMVADGMWLEYIKNELNYEKSTAQNYMRLYERYGTGQQSMFGTFAETETFGRLTYTKALALLQVPDEDLLEFAENNDIENMSTRELQQAIRERDTAISDREAAVAQVGVLQEKVDIQDKVVDKLTADLKSVNGDYEAKVAEVEKLRNDLRSAKEKETAAKSALKKAKENPDIPETVMEKLRAEAEAAATERATADAKRKLDAAAKELEAVQEDLRRTREAMEAAQKEAKLQNPDAAVFKSLFEQVQSDFNRLTEVLLKIRQTDPELGGKLSNAVDALVSKLHKDIGEAE